ncbi:sugar phosphate nucleotidyltransferase [Cohnella sp. JJ-181]|uniref:sugar phosphate nucleotidyltransferase n=1 Tax=Cohnella rhizoplanae TaxID=2974897 RepID=UPI0022FFC3A9|nr:sugar phosphate nucleotidyltransferase [Cohnella sp. JJ-181]CAI6029454.1 Glucose-1-phosphate adenylyltransferase [Cohnella sp. JJ-181]
MSKRNVLAMLLAGGEGKRLAPLTQQWAKPAVPFGGKQRIIDFPISNCLNSGIGDIGIVTQYRAESIHQYLGEAEPWTPGSQAQRGQTLLPADRLGGSGYLGTADAIFQNIDYIDSHDPEDILILSGDHIYQMDYAPLLAAHRESGASATIVVKNVSWEEASRFGIMSTDERGRIVDFAEKPAAPKSNLASMGVYVFRWSELRRYLLQDAANPASSRDFGKDLIPRALADGEAFHAYKFGGYWRDVGTIDSLWEANMDLLDGAVHIGTPEWPMNASALSSVVHYSSGAYAQIRGSLIHQGVAARGEIERSVVSIGSQIGAHSQIRDSVVMPHAKIGKHAKIHRAIIGEGAIIEDYAVVGGDGSDIVVIAPGERVKANVYMAPAFDRIKDMKERIVGAGKLDQPAALLTLAE